MTTSIRSAVLLLTLIALAACGGGDRALRLPKLPDGGSRADVLAALGSGPLTAIGNDTLRLADGFRRQVFMVGGHRYEVIFFRRAPGSLEEDITRDVEVPVVLRDDVLLHSGWEKYDQLAGEVGLPNWRARDAAEAARLRSLAPAPLEAATQPADQSVPPA
jgi:hypothetical protein